MNIVGKDITFTRKAVLEDKDGKEFVIPAGTRLIIEGCSADGENIILQVKQEDNRNG